VVEEGTMPLFIVALGVSRLKPARLTRRTMMIIHCILLDIVGSGDVTCSVLQLVESLPQTQDIDAGGVYDQFSDLEESVKVI
jgi:hypothetical protein